MSKGPKTTTTQTQTQAGTTANTYGYETPPDTPDIQNLREFKFQSDPSQPYIYGRAKQDLERQSQNPYGSYTTPAVREAALKTGTMNLTQQQGQSSAQENAQLNNMQYAQKAGVADLTRPQLVQTGGNYSGTGSGTGTSQQSGGIGQMILASAIQGASSGASAGMA